MKINNNSLKISTASYYDKIIKKHSFLNREEEDILFNTLLLLKKEVIETLFDYDEVFKSIREMALVYLEKDNVLDFFLFNIEDAQDNEIDDILEFYYNSIEEFINSDNKSNIKQLVSSMYYTNEVYDSIIQMVNKDLIIEYGLLGRLELINAIRNRILEKNIALPIEITLKYKNTIKIPLEDAIQVAIIGLSSAIDKHNPLLKTKLSTSAYYWIFQAIQRYDDTNFDLISIPCNIVAMNKKNNKIISEIIKRDGKFPTSDTICDEAGNDSYLVCNNKYDSFESQISIKNENLSLGDIIKDEGIVDNLELMATSEITSKLKNIINELSDVEKSIVEMAYGCGKEGKTYTNKDIMKLLNIDAYSFNRCKKRALEFIKDKVEYDINFTNWNDSFLGE